MTLSNRLVKLVCILSCWTAALAVPCKGATHRLGIDLPNKQIQRVNAYDGADSRETIEHYAQSHNLNLDELRKTVSATGKLKCPGGSASANLTLSSSIITTSLHTFCEFNERPSQCTFVYNNGKVQHEIAIAQEYQAGEKCDPKLMKALYSVKSPFNDWVVLKLTKPADGLKPYRIDPQLIDHSLEGTKLILVSEHSIDFCTRDTKGGCVRDHRTGKFKLPKNLGDCELRYVATHHQIATQYISNCASGPGSSGGALLTGSMLDPVLAGLQSAGAEDWAIEAQERRTGTPVIRPFSIEDKWYSAGVPMNGALAEAVYRAAVK